MTRPYGMKVQPCDYHSHDEELSSSQRNSVDSATSATQVQLTKCYTLLHAINAEIERIDNENLGMGQAEDEGSYNPANARMSLRRREWLINSSAILKLRVDTIIKEKTRED